MKIYRSISEMVGHTPLLEVCNYEKAHGLNAHLLCKIESCNVAGSSKDRAAKFMIECAEKSGKLKDGTVIIEPTSGNTGIGLAAMAKAHGYRVILTMPETMSSERRNLLRAYGAELVLTDGTKGMAGAIEEAERLAKELSESFIPAQFDNPDNTASHYCTTGPELWDDTDGKVDVFVAGVGTGGTISGTARFLREKNPKVHIVAVEPANSPILSGGQAGSHNLQGIGANFVPRNFERDLVDEIITVYEQDAYRAGRELVQREGILTGITSGAALWAATEVAKRPEFAGKNIIAFLPDGGEKYLSTPMYQEEEEE